MHNELLHIGPLTVYGYGFMIAMGVLAAWFVAEQRARKLKLACDPMICLGFCRNSLQLVIQNKIFADVNPPMAHHTTR